MKHLSELPAWRQLWPHYEEMKSVHMRDLFARDPDRARRYWLEVGGLTLDYAKNRITGQTLNGLFELARESGLPEKMRAMFAGEKINNTENRAALHIALRNRADTPIYVDGENVMPKVNSVLRHMGRFAHAVRNGDWTGYTGQAITDIVNIGIGGSDQGPLMMCTALQTYGHPRLNMHFVSNVDGTQLRDVLEQVRPETTLFIIASKTFTTQETLTNAHTARDWFLRAGREEDIAKHFVAVSTNKEAVSAFGIDTANMFEFWNWVGGRYSLWSAIGLPIMIYLGEENFIAMLEGAHLMDQHFINAPFEQNMPVLLGMIGIWYINYFGGGSHVIAPYDQHLHHLPRFIQQLDMESNGKQTACDGTPVGTDTGPIIWGETGINGQHAFFQLLHQGTHITPIDLIASLEKRSNLRGHHEILLANVFAQAEAFMRGKTPDEVRAELKAQGMEAERIEALDETHRRQPAFATDRVTSLGDITMFTTDDDIRLGEVLIKLRNKESSQPASLNWRKASATQLHNYFAEIVPNYDRDRVHNSDIKKLIQWYNILISAGITDFEEIFMPKQDELNSQE